MIDFDNNEDSEFVDIGKLVNDADLFGDPLDTLADDFLKKTNNVNIIKPKQTFLSGKEEFNEFIKLRNLNRKSTCEMFFLHENIKAFHNVILDIENNNIDYMSVFERTYPETDITYEKVFDRTEINDTEKIDTNLLINSLEGFDALYYKYQENLQNGNFKKLDEISGEMSILVNALKFSNDLMRSFNVNKGMFERETKDLSLELRSLMVDDCKISAVDCITYINSNSLSTDLSFDDFHQSLKNISNNPEFVERRFRETNDFFNTAKALSNKYKMSIGRMNELVDSFKTIEKERHKSINIIMDANDNWLHSLVQKRTSKFPNPNNDINNELYSAARLGYTIGIGRYDLESGNRISAFATFYAENEIREATKRIFNMISIPESDRADMALIKGFREKSYLDYGKRPTDTEIAKELGITVEHVRLIDLSYSNLKTTSLNDTLGEDGDGTRIDRIDGGLTVDWEDLEKDRLQREFLSLRIAVLDPIERLAIQYTNPRENGDMNFVDLNMKFSAMHINGRYFDDYFRSIGLNDNEYGKITVNRVKLISDYSKNKLRLLSNIKTDIIKQVMIINDAIEFLSNKNDDVSSTSVANMILVNIESLQTMVGVFGRLGVDIKVTDKKACMDSLDDKYINGLINGNQDEINSMGFKDVLESVQTDILKTDMVLGLVNQSCNSTPSIDVLNARVDVVSSFSINELKQAMKEDVEGMNLKDNSLKNSSIELK